MYTYMKFSKDQVTSQGLHNNYMYMYSCNQWNYYLMVGAGTFLQTRDHLLLHLQAASKHDEVGPGSRQSGCGQTPDTSEPMPGK